MMNGVSLRYVVGTYANITMHTPVQLLHANKINFNKGMVK